MALNEQSPIARNPEYFSIWRVGEWNDSIGEIVPEVKECLGNAVDLIRFNAEKEI